MICNTHHVNSRCKHWSAFFEVNTNDLQNQRILVRSP